MQTSILQNSREKSKFDFAEINSHQRFYHKIIQIRHSIKGLKEKLQFSAFLNLQTSSVQTSQPIFCKLEDCVFYLSYLVITPIYP